MTADYPIIAHWDVNSNLNDGVMDTEEWPMMGSEQLFE
jgi:hypothetical protein